MYTSSRDHSRDNAVKSFNVYICLIVIVTIKEHEHVERARHLDKSINLKIFQTA